jgi:N-acetylneuraminic acid mutarotase
MRKIGNVVLIGIFFILGLLCMTSICFAQSDTWTPITNIPTPRGWLSTSGVDGKIYAIGGYKTFPYSVSTVEVYDTVTDNWDTTKASMPTARWLSGTTNTAVVGKIYAIGGLITFPGDGISTVEVYDTVTDTWDTKAPMPTARSHLATCVLDGKIYAIGGSIGSSSSWPGLPTVEMYDPVTDTWTTKAPMPTARWGLCASSVNGKIYAIGGTAGAPTYGGLSKVEEYDPVTDTWTTKASMTTPRLDLTGVELFGKIYAIGGIDRAQGTGHGTVEAYDPVTDMWTLRNDLPPGGGGSSASTVNGQIYLFGNMGPGPTYSPIAEVLVYNPPVIAVWEEISGPPNVFTLKQNYPNPFNPITTIQYALPHKSDVLITIFDILGRHVKTLVTQTQDASYKSIIWDATNTQGQSISAGMYFYQIKAGDFIQTKKMVLLK